MAGEAKEEDEGLEGDRPLEPAEALEDLKVGEVPFLESVRLAVFLEESVEAEGFPALAPVPSVPAPVPPVVVELPVTPLAFAPWLPERVAVWVAATLDPVN